MSEASTAPQSARRRLSFQTTDEVVTEVNRLRHMPLKPRAKWNLPQACHHIAATVEGGLTPADTLATTPEEKANRDGFFEMLFAPEGMPAGLPTSESVTPPHDCGEEAFDRLISAFAKLSSFPHTHVKVTGCGPVPIDDVVKLHLAHAAHHLSFQDIVTPPRDGLRYTNVQSMIDDVENLRHGYTQGGNLSLPQMSFHLSRALRSLDVPVTRTELTEEESDAQGAFQHLAKGGKVQQGRPMPPASVPPADAGDAEIDELLAGLRKLNAAKQPIVQFGRFGPVKLDEFKVFILTHSAHHLAFLEPTTVG